MATTTDYDAPRATRATSDSIEQLLPPRRAPNGRQIDAAEYELAVDLEMQGDYQLDEELSVAVVAIRTDEFRCERCFLIHHRSRRIITGDDPCPDD